MSPPDPTLPEAVLPTASPTGATTRRPLVLNVDNDTAGRTANTSCLRLAQLSVIEAIDRTTALASIRQDRPSLVLLFNDLPDGRGVEICRQIKREWPDIIVIRVSAAAVITAEQVIGGDSGADCYLTSPVEPVELIAVTRAMLRLRNAEIQTQESGEHYRVMVESALDDAIFTCGLDGRMTSWNAGAQAIFGYARAEAIGQPAARIFTADEVISDQPEQEMRAARHHTIVQGERWHRRRDGSRFWSSSRMVSLRGGSGQIVGYLKIVSDRSAEKQARDALEALTAELDGRVADRTRDLRAANERLIGEIAERKATEDQFRHLQKIEALGQLTGGLAHDFNNLLTAILGGLEVIRRRIDDPRTLRLVDSSVSAAERGARLIAQLVAFAGRQKLHVERVVLNTLVTEMLALLEPGVGSAVTLSLDLHADAWPVLADAAQVQTALLNLTSNACDAMPAGGTLWIITGNEIVADADSGRALAAGDYGTLCVRDTGTGMSETVLTRLFEPFFTTKEAGKGTGLGLAHVYGFARQSGGDVRVISTLGQGTSITLLLPRAVDAATTAVDPAGG